MSTCIDLVDSDDEQHPLEHNLTLRTAQNIEIVREQKTAEVIREDLHGLDKGIAHIIKKPRLGPELNKSRKDINSVSVDTDYDITVNYDPLENSSKCYYNLDAPKVSEKRDLSINDSGHSSLIQESYLSSKDIFYEKSNLSSHLRTHSSMPHQESFTEKWHVTNNSSDHNGPVEHVCNVCNERFDEKSVYLTHTQSHYLSLRPHVCDFCNESFTDNYILIQHARIHENTPYECIDCDKSFITKESFQKHLITHTDYRPCVCDVCGKRFRYKYSLGKHERIHDATLKPFECSVCKRRFRRKKDLFKHSRGHDKKLYECSICNNRYYDLRNLNTHASLHLSNTANGCNVCNKIFPNKGLLASHKRLAHPSVDTCQNKEENNSYIPLPIGNKYLYS